MLCLKEKLTQENNLFKYSGQALFFRWPFVIAIVFLPYFSLAQIITETFTSSGTFTVPAGVTSITVEGYGGGGAGGGSTSAGFIFIFPFGRGGGGGGGGGFASSVLSVTPGQTISVNVGSGGVGVSGNNGGAGGNSFLSGFTSDFLAAGGSGGSGNTSGGSPSGGSGGNSNVGNISTINGANGGAGETSIFSVISGFGGRAFSLLGGLGGLAVLGTSNGIIGNTFGGGGSGSATLGNAGNRIGGSGAPGRVSITYEISIALPIELIDFSAYVNNKNQTVIEWATASEKNNDFFTIERSSNGLNFQEIARFPGAGDHIGRLDYRYLDALPLNGYNYYRLRQTDFDGTFTYSQLVRVFVPNSSQQANFIVSKNPIEKNGILELSSFQNWDFQVDLTFQIFDQLGRQFYRGVIPAKQELNEVKLDGINFGSGAYIIQIRQKNIKVSKRIIVR